MTKEKLLEIRGLLTTERVLALAVLVDGAPYCGLLPYAIWPDYSAVLVQASGLARHSRGLQQGASFSVLIHPADQADGDPLQIPRLTLQGMVEILERGSDEYGEAEQVYVRRFRSAQQTLGFADFNLFLLRFAKARYVGGFAQAVNLGPEDFKRLK